MLHILWMIFKVILILLGILLGVLLAMILLVLFCPVRYQAEAEGSLQEWKKVRGTVRVSWLFRGVSVKAVFSGGKLNPEIRLLGISLNRFLKKRTAPEPSEKAENPKAAEKEKPRKIPEPEKTPELPEPEKLPELPEPDRPEEQPAEQKEKTKHTKEKPVEPEEKMAEPEETQVDPKEKTGFFRKIRNKFSGLMEKLKNIQKTIEELREKIRGVREKLEQGKAFLTEPRVKEAMSYVWKKLKTLIRHVFPRKLEGRITFGWDDPSVTGMVLAAMGITMPFHRNCVELNPLFDGEKVLEGTIKLRGRIYAFMLLKTFLQVYFHKNIRYVIHRWKHRKG